MKCSKIFILVVLFSVHLLSQASATIEGVAQWASSVIACEDNSQFNSITTDRDGNVYAAGNIGSYVYNLGNGVSVNGAFVSRFGGTNVVLVKYSSVGNAQWARSVLTGSSGSNFNSVTVDNSGNLYVVGTIDGTDIFSFGNDVVINGFAGSNGVLVKYDGIGNAKWAKSVISSNNNSSFFHAVTTGADGSIYVVGLIDGSDTLDFGNGVKAKGSYDDGTNIILIKYDSNGNAQWAKTTNSGVCCSMFQALTIDRKENIYAVGSICGFDTLGFGNGVKVKGPYGGPYNDGANIILIKYDSNGNVQWGKSTVSSDDSSQFNSVVIDNDNNIYACGSIMKSNPFDFGNGVTVSGISDKNSVVVKYDENGNAQWAKTAINGADDSEFHAVTIDSKGNVYAFGSIHGSSTFDFGNGVTINGAYHKDNSVVLIKYNSNGNAQWAQSVTTSKFNSRYYLGATHVGGNIYAAGEIGGDITDFGNGVTAKGISSGDFATNFVLVKYLEETVPQESWWKKNKGYIYLLGIGGAIVGGGACLVCAAPVTVISGVVNAAGTIAGGVIHLGIPLVGWIVTPKSTISYAEDEMALINPLAGSEE